MPRYIRQTLHPPSSGTPVRIYGLGDIHFGHGGVAIPALQEAIRHIQDDQGGYWVGTGDYFDLIFPGDKRYAPPPTRDSPPRRHPRFTSPEQFEDCFCRLRDMLEPISEKCLGLVDGNHETSYSSRTCMPSPTASLARHLGAPFLQSLGIIRVLVSKVGTFTLALHHGAGAGAIQTFYKKALSLSHLCNAAVVLMGHTHMLAAFYLPKPTLQGGTTGDKTGLAVCCGTFFYSYPAGIPTFAERRLLPPGSMGMGGVEVATSTARLTPLLWQPS